MPRNRPNPRLSEISEPLSTPESPMSARLAYGSPYVDYSDRKDLYETYYALDYFCGRVLTSHDNFYPVLKLTRGGMRLIGYTSKANDYPSDTVSKVWMPELGSRAVCVNPSFRRSPYVVADGGGRSALRRLARKTELGRWSNGTYSVTPELRDYFKGGRPQGCSDELGYLVFSEFGRVIGNTLAEPPANGLPRIYRGVPYYRLSRPGISCAWVRNPDAGEFARIPEDDDGAYHVADYLYAHCDEDGLWTSSCECTSCMPYDEDEDEDEDDTSSYLYPYHGSRRPWVGQPIAPMAVGFENELYTERRSELADALHDDTVTAKTVVCERDSSLDDRCGIEIISAAKPLSEMRDIAYRVCELARSHRGKSATADYGLHVSICAENWSELRCSKFSAWFLWQTELVDLYARRDETSYCYRSKTNRHKQVIDGSHSAAVNMGHLHWHRDGHHKGYSRGVASGRVEVRIFRSTVRAERLIAAMELVHAVAEYSAICGASRDDITDRKAFWDMVWQKPKTYRYLVSYAESLGLDVYRPTRVKKTITAESVSTGVE